MITTFKTKETEFLSNFYPVEINYRGAIYASVEHAYMSAKSDDPVWKVFCQNKANKAGDVKRESKKIKLVPEWDKIKFQVMLSCLRAKFQNPKLQAMLLSTGDQNLQEGNTWGDRIWGVDLKVNPNIGENHLGRLLMKVREEIRRDNYFNETYDNTRTNQSELEERNLNK